MNVFKIFTRKIGANDRFHGINLGDGAQDTLTGFSGVVVSQNSCISGCDQVALQPEMSDGKFEDSRWFDIERIEQTQAGKVKLTDRRAGADAVPPSRTPKDTI